MSTAAPSFRPHEVQNLALAALAKARSLGERAGLVVLATGLGKTWLSAFDFGREPAFRTLLFVAHRREILEQAQSTFLRLQPSASTGLYTGEEKVEGADLVFASIQTLSRQSHLQRFPRDRFDYVVIDEFHHAAAQSYRRLLEYFEPRFLLGLTATPERTDGGDLLKLCGGNKVYRCDLKEGIDRGLLSPFRYFGVPDDIDYANIPWRNGRFREDSLEVAWAKTSRAQNAFEQWAERKGSRTLAFCCSVNHAKYMRDYFVNKGVNAAAVFAEHSSDPRAETLQRFREGRVDIIFCVDVFNEGVDVPEIDTILMLRPTESKIIWLQQLGRGLRKCGSKVVSVIDYIGNHRSFLLKVQSLLSVGERHSDITMALEKAYQKELDLPVGCEVTYTLEVRDILESLLDRYGDVSWDDLEAIQTLDGIPTFDSSRKLATGDREFDGFLIQHAVMHGRRPSAVEAYYEGFNFKMDRWMDILCDSPFVKEIERQELNASREFLLALANTGMNKSYKMVVLLSMLQVSSIPGIVRLDDLLQPFKQYVARSTKLSDDLGPALETPKELRRRLLKGPMTHLTNGEEARYFAFKDGIFQTTLAVTTSNPETLGDLVREVCEWKLAVFLDSKRAETNLAKAIARAQRGTG